MNEVIEAESQADDLWNRVLFGELVSCQESITNPPLFELSSIEESPDTLLIKQYLDAAVIGIHQVALRWDAECQIERNVIPLDVVRDAQADLLDAHQALQQAIALWGVWQS
ncbi:MAG: hypothetical protein H6673_11700 [Anaerolineales bacterium]|nr:hypothetical protein [Anaerolineales bacterium]